MKKSKKLKREMKVKREAFYNRVEASLRENHQIFMEFRETPDYGNSQYDKVVHLLIETYRRFWLPGKHMTITINSNKGRAKQRLSRFVEYVRKIKNDADTEILFKHPKVPVMVSYCNVSEFYSIEMEIGSRTYNILMFETLEAYRYDPDKLNDMAASVSTGLNKVKFGLVSFIDTFNKNPDNVPAINQFLTKMYYQKLIVETGDVEIVTDDLYARSTLSTFIANLWENGRKVVIKCGTSNNTQTFASNGKTHYYLIRRNKRGSETLCMLAEV